MEFSSSCARENKMSDHADASKPDWTSIRDWPFATDLVLRTPQPDVIESHAIAWLAKGLHTLRLTAFVGSGASTAYGRTSWIDMLYSAQQTVLERCKEDKSPNQNRFISAGEELLSQIKISRGSDADASSQLAVFQIAEDLDNILSRSERNTNARSLRMTFRETVMWATRDHRGHAEQLLVDALSDPDFGKPPHKWTDEDVRKKLWGINVPAPNRSIPIPDQDPGVLDQELSNSISWLNKQWKKHFVSSNEAGKHMLAILRKPSQRYRLAAWLRSLQLAQRQSAFLCLVGALRKSRSREQSQSATSNVRHERDLIVDPRRDPLRILHSDLKLSRFLTTNYDHEIERLFDALGYRQTSETDETFHSDARSNPVSKNYRDVTFGQRWIGDVTSFATMGASSDCWIAHLHGRSEMDGTGQIVATDDDYRKHYARKDSVQPLLDEAVRLAFMAGPLLFVGIGMDEIDLLRPLREFVGTAQSGHHIDKIAIALLPAEQSSQKRIARKIDLLRRYGVYTIHFGAATMPGAHSASSPTTLWLECIASLKKDVDDIAGRFQDISTFGENLGDKPKWNRFVTRVRAAVQPLASHIQKARRLGYWDSDKLVVPQAIETVDASSFNISREIGEISESIRLCLSIPILVRDIPTARCTTWAAIRRSLQARRVLVAGAYTSLLTVCLCATLQRAHRQSRQWIDLWRQLPPPRRPVFTIEEFSFAGRAIPIMGRHPVYLQPLEVGATGNASVAVDKVDSMPLFRFYAGAPSQTFNTLLSALGQLPPLAAEQRSARLFLLLCRPGLGKGHFFAALHSDDRLRQLISALGLTTANHQLKAAAFLNLSFSVELSSVFDRLIEFMMEQVNPHYATTLNWNALRRDRLKRCAFALQELAKQSTTDRIIIALNGINVLFDQNGNARNRQLGRLFTQLLDAIKNRPIPIDLILVCSETAIPANFRGKDSQFRTTLLNRTPVKEKTKIFVRQALHNLGISFSESDDVREASSNPDTFSAFVHLMHEARASVMITAFFPTVALTIAVKELLRTGKRPHITANFTLPHTASNVITPEAARSVRLGVKKFLGGSGFQNDTIHAYQRRVIPYLVAGAAVGFMSGRCCWEEIIDHLSAIRHQIAGTEDAVLKQISHEIATTIYRTGYRAFEVEVLAQTIDTLALRFDAYMKRIFDAASGARFSVTLLMATAYEILFTGIPEHRAARLNHSELLCFDESMNKTMAYLDSALHRLGLLHAPEREGVIIESAFDQHEALLAAGKGFAKLPIVGRAFGSRLQHKVFQVQQWILWHLAVIGIPVSSDVLAQCPLIREAVLGSASKPRLDFEYCKGIVDAVLEVMLARCLVFCIKDSPQTDNRSKRKRKNRSSNFRYTLHRSIQGYIFSRLGAPFIADVDVDRFTLSLFASQPPDLPQLNPEGHQNLRRTVAALTGYPEIEGRQRLFPATRAESKLRGAMFRAAYGITRTIYSVASLARFGVEHESINSRYLGDVSAGPGFFEEHRLQLWRLIWQAGVDPAVRMSVASGQEAGESPFDKALLEQNDTLSAPFYAEEIVWIYNEIAVLSLVQGRLQDAFDIFDLALLAVGEIEPNHDGPLSNILMLNQSVAEIERGNLARAERSLEKIKIRLLYPEDRELNAIATGYLGLVEHIQGNVAAAERNYRKALKDLDGAARAASIFSRHLGDLARAISPNSDEADKYIRRALQLAREASQEDVRHLAILSEARNMLKAQKADGANEIHVRLDMVERYSLVMGTPRITCEVFEIRARLHRQTGDLRNAGSAAAEALRIASFHDLRVRKASILVLYADIILRQGFKEISAPMVEEAMLLAREINYFAAYAEGQELKHRIETGQSGGPLAPATTKHRFRMA